MVQVVFLGVILIAVSVAFRYGYLYSKAKENLRRLQELYHGQEQIIKAFGKMLEQSHESQALLEKIEHAKTIQDLQSIYNDLTS